MKIICYVVVAFLWGVTNSYSQTPATFGSFVASSPCGNVVRPLLKMPFEQECDFVKWKITLHQDPITKAPTTFSLTAVYGLSQPSTTGFINGGTQVEATGKWLMTKGTQANPDAVVYQLNPDQPALSLSFVKMDDKIIHLLYNDKSLMIGNAGYSYTFNKAKN